MENFSRNYVLRMSAPASLLSWKIIESLKIMHSRTTGMYWYDWVEASRSQLHLLQ